MYKYNPNNMISLLLPKYYYFLVLFFVFVFVLFFFTKVYKTNNSLYLQPNTAKSARSTMKNRLQG